MPELAGKLAEIEWNQSCKYRRPLVRRRLRL